MYLIQILLPLYDNGSKRIPAIQFKRVKRELTDKFHGLTAYSRSVAEGFWAKGKSTRRDAIIVYEVMAPTPQRRWWKQYRQELEKRFRQEEVIIRAQKIVVL